MWRSEADPLQKDSVVRSQVSLPLSCLIANDICRDVKLCNLKSYFCSKHVKVLLNDLPDNVFSVLLLFWCNISEYMRSDGSVGIATRYDLDIQRIRSR